MTKQEKHLKYTESATWLGSQAKTRKLFGGNSRDLWLWAARVEIQAIKALPAHSKISLKRISRFLREAQNSARA
jgi:hypothetical protein